MKDSYRFLKLEGKEIAAWAEYYVSEEHSAYYPAHLLMFVKRGTLNIRVAEKVKSFDAPAYVLVRKNSLGFFRKTWRPPKEKAEVFVLLLRNDFIQAAIQHTDLPAPSDTAEPPAFTSLEPGAYLTVFFDRLPEYFRAEVALTVASVALATGKIIEGCLADNPALLHMFCEVNTPIGFHVKNIVDHYYDTGLNVEELAELAGISLSSFYRVFRKEFGGTPHQWLMSRRLQTAYELLKNADNSVTDVCYQTGFKDVAHFSRRFKQRFGVPPSAV